MTPRRAMCGFVLAAALTGGCAVEVPFELTWALRVAAPPHPMAAELPIDLAEQESLWSRRDAVQEVTVDALTLGVVAVGTANRAQTVRVALRYRGDASDSDGAEVSVLEPSELQLVPGAQLTAVPPAGLGTTVLEALQGSGRLTLVVETDAGGPVDATLALGLEGSVTVTP